MNEEKLYVVKNDEGKYIAVTNDWLVHWYENSGDLFDSLQKASKWETTLGGHIVTLIEEPKKVVLSKEQAEIVEEARGQTYPADYISGNSGLGNSGEEELLMNAFVNGYTVAKEKKYLLPMDGTLEENDDNDNFQLYAYCHKGRWLADECETDPSYKHQTVTQKDLEKAPAWVKAIKPVEVTDDDE